MYAVPIAVPPLAPNGGSTILSSTPTVEIPYDVGQEFPADPLRLMIAWANGYWVAVGVYNGK
jgi:hypothetical protein